MLPEATTGFNMAAKHEIEGNALRAHLRQEVEFKPKWLLSERLYQFNETNKQIKKQIEYSDHRSVSITGQFR